MKRIAYIREFDAVPRHGPERGVNPYAKEFGILPIDELKRRLTPYAAILWGKRDDTIKLGDIARECHTSSQSIRAFVDGKYSFGNDIRRRLTRVLVALDRGLLVKRNGQMLRVETPERKPDHVYRVCISPYGKPTIVRGEQPAEWKPLPKLFASLKLPGR